MGKLAHTHTARIVGCRSVEPRSLSSLISLSWASHRQSTSVEIVLLSVSSFEPVKKCWLDPECTMVGWPQDAEAKIVYIACFKPLGKSSLNWCECDSGGGGGLKFASSIFRNFPQFRMFSQFSFAIFRIFFPVAHAFEGAFLDFFFCIVIRDDFSDVAPFPSVIWMTTPAFFVSCFGANIKATS